MLRLRVLIHNTKLLSSEGFMRNLIILTFQFIRQLTEKGIQVLQCGYRYIAIAEYLTN